MFSVRHQLKIIILILHTHQSQSSTKIHSSAANGRAPRQSRPGSAQHDRDEIVGDLGHVIVLLLHHIGSWHARDDDSVLLFFSRLLVYYYICVQYRVIQLSHDGGALAAGHLYSEMSQREIKLHNHDPTIFLLIGAARSNITVV